MAIERPEAKDYASEQAARGSGQIANSYDYLASTNPVAYYYEKLKSQGNPYLNATMWTKAAEKGESANLIHYLSKYSGETEINNDYLKIWEDNAKYNDNDFDTYMLALSIPHLNDTVSKDRTTTLEDGSEYSFGSYTDKEWAIYLFENQKSKWEAQALEEKKANEAWWKNYIVDPFLQLVGVDTLKVLSGALKAGDDLVNVFEGFLNIFLNESNDDDIGKRFLYAFQNDNDPFEVFEKILDYAAYEIERQNFSGVNAVEGWENGYRGLADGDNFLERIMNTEVVDGGGRHGVAALNHVVFSAIGEMIPSMMIPGGGGLAAKGINTALQANKVTRVLGITTSSIVKEGVFYTQIASGNISDTLAQAKYAGVSYKDLNAGTVIGNASIKAAAQWAIGLALRGVLGTTGIDRLMGAANGTSKILTRTAAKTSEAVNKLGSKASSALKVVGRGTANAGKEGLEEFLQDLSDGLIDMGFGNGNGVLNNIYANQSKQTLTVGNLLNSFMVGAVMSITIGSVKNAQFIGKRVYGANADGTIYKLGVFETINFKHGLELINEWNSIVQNEKASEKDRKNAAFKLATVYNTMSNLYRSMSKEEVTKANQLLLAKAAIDETKESALMEMSAKEYSQNLVDEFLAAQVDARAKYIDQKLEAKIKKAAEKDSKKLKNNFVTVIKEIFSKKTKTGEDGLSTTNEVTTTVVNAMDKLGAEAIVGVDGDIISKSDDVIFVDNKLLAAGDIKTIVEGVAYEQVIEAVTTQLNKSQKTMLVSQYNKITQATGTLEDAIVALLFDKNFYCKILLVSGENKYQLNAIKMLATIDQLLAKRLSASITSGTMTEGAYTKLMTKVKSNMRAGLINFATNYCMLDLGVISNDVLSSDIKDEIKANKNYQVTETINKVAKNTSAKDFNAKDKARFLSVINSLDDRLSSDEKNEMIAALNSNDLDKLADVACTLKLIIRNANADGDSKVIYLEATPDNYNLATATNTVVAFTGIAWQDLLDDNIDTTKMTPDFQQYLENLGIDWSNKFDRYRALDNLLFNASQGSFAVDPNGTILQVFDQEEFLKDEYSNPFNGNDNLLDDLKGGYIKTLQDISKLKLSPKIGSIKIVYEGKNATHRGWFDLEKNEIHLTFNCSINTVMHEATHATQYQVGQFEDIFAVGANLKVLEKLSKTTQQSIVKYIRNARPMYYKRCMTEKLTLPQIIYLMIDGEMKARATVGTISSDLGLLYNRDKTKLLSPDGKQEWSLIVPVIKPKSVNKKSTSSTVNKAGTSKTKKDTSETTDKSLKDLEDLDDIDNILAEIDRQLNEVDADEVVSDKGVDKNGEPRVFTKLPDKVKNDIKNNSILKFRVYHGSPNKIDKFDFKGDKPNNFFTSELKYANGYNTNRDTGENGYIYSGYLVIKHPFSFKVEKHAKLAQYIITREGFDPKHPTPEDTDEIYKYLVEHDNSIAGVKFDGIVASEGMTIEQMNRKNLPLKSNQSYVPLSNDQIYITDVLKVTPENSKMMDDNRIVEKGWLTNTTISEHKISFAEKDEKKSTSKSKADVKPKVIKVKQASHKIKNSTVYVNNKEASKSNLKYFIKKGKPIFLHKKVIDFITNTTEDFDKLSSYLQKQIKNGDLNYFKLLNYVATASSMNDYTFKAIAKYLFNNEDASKLTFKEMIKVFDKLQNYEVLSYTLDKAGKSEDTYTIEQLDEMYKALVKDAEIDEEVSKEFNRAYKLASTVRLAPGKYVEINSDPRQLTVIFMRHYNGKLSSLRDVNILGKWLAANQQTLTMESEVLEKAANGGETTTGAPWNYIDKMKIAEVDYDVEESLESLSIDDKLEAIEQYLTQYAANNIAKMSPEQQAEIVKHPELIMKQIDAKMNKIRSMSNEDIDKQYLKIAAMELKPTTEQTAKDIGNSNGSSRKTLKDSIRSTNSRLQKKLLNLKNRQTRSLKNYATQEYTNLSTITQKYIVPETWKLNEKYRKATDEELANLLTAMRDDNRKLQSQIRASNSAAKLTEKSNKRNDKLAKQLAAEKVKNEKLSKRINQLKQDKQSMKERVAAKYQTKVEQQKFSFTSDTKPNRVVDNLLKTQFSKTRMSKVQGLSNNQEEMVASGKEFFTANTNTLMSMTTDEAEQASLWFMTSLMNNVDSDSYKKFQTVKLLFLGYVYQQAGDGKMFEGFNSNIKQQIENHLKNEATGAGLTLSVWNQTLNVIDPFRRFAMADMEIDGVVLTSDQKESLFDAIKSNDPKRIREEQLKLYEIIKQQKPQTQSIFRKIISFRSMMMLSSPMTWLRNFVSNFALKRIYKWSDKIGKHMFTGKAVEGQLKLDKPVTKEIQEFIDKNFVDNKFFDNFVSKISKYNPSDLGDGKYKVSANGLQAKEQLYARIVLKAMYSEYYNETTFKSKFMQTLHQKLMKVLSDDSYVRQSVIRTFGKILAEKGYDLSKGELTDEIMNDFSKALGIGMSEYMHSENMFHQIERWLSDRSELGHFAYKMLLPYAASTWNWFKAMLKLSPMGLARSIAKMFRLEKNIVKQNAKFLSGKTQVSGEFAEFMIRRDLGQGVIGTMLWMLGMGLAALGMIGLDDDDYGVPKLKIGNLEIDVSAIFGSSSLLAGAAMITQVKKNGLTFDAFIDGLDASVDVWLDSMPLMQIVEMDMYSNGGFSMGMSQLESMSLSFMPNLLNWVAGATYSGTLKKTTYLDKVLARIPFLANLVEKKVDIYTGETGSYLDTINRTLPYISIIHASDNENKTTELGLNKSMLRGEYNINNKKFKITGKELTTVNRIYGEMNGDDLTKFYSNNLSVSVKVGNKYKKLTYNNMTDEQRKNAVQNIMSNNAELAKIIAWTSTGNKYYASNVIYNKLVKAGYKTNLCRGTKGFVEA